MEAVPARVHEASRGFSGGIAWLLDLADNHRAAVRYDLLRHGYRLEWMGTRRLPWGDAFALLSMQPPTQSAVFRALYPDQYNTTRESQILEVMAVILQTANIQRGNQTKAKASDFPREFKDLFPKAQKTPKGSEEEILAGIKRMQELLAE